MNVLGLNGKRAISPLMATVLLVAFSIALGAVVMSWGQGYVETKSEFTTGAGANELGTGCDKIMFDIISVKNVPQVCYTPDEINLFIENGIAIELTNIQARIVGSDGVAQAEILKQPLKPVDAVKTSFGYSGIGTPSQLKLIPKITAGSTEIFCADKAVVIDELREC